MKKMLSCLCVAGLAGVVLTGVAEDLAPLPLELPKPMFKGTPVPAKVPNLRKPLGGPRPPLMVPKGVVNISKGKSVTASDDFPVIGELEMITDGDKSGADGSFVELGPMVQWAQIDLGSPHELYAIVVWHFHSQARVYNDVIVQVADDKEFKTNVRTLFNNDIDNSSELGAGKDTSYIETSEGELVPAKGEKAQFVRCYSNGSTADEMNHYVEIEVFGLPAK
jgi:hypothetical protein